MVGKDSIKKYKIIFPLALTICLFVLVLLIPSYLNVRANHLRCIVLSEIMAIISAVIGLYSSYKQNKKIFISSQIILFVSLYYAWKFLTATGALLVYFPITILIWLGYASEKQKTSARIKLLQTLCWVPVFIGMALMLVSHVVTIFEAIF